VSELLTPEGIEGCLESLGLCHHLPRPCLGGRPPLVAGGAALDAAASEGLAFVSRGGKFLRPILTLAAYDAVAADTGGAGARRTTASAAALAIEVFHKASLVHDDIEDGDSVRYGRPTIHAAIGVPAAVNVGDFLVGLGYAIVSHLPVERSASGDRAEDSLLAADLLRVLSDCHVKLARGQGAELWWRDSASHRASPEEVIETYALKTSPAFEAALSMGVRIAGVDPADAGPLAAFARHVGNAFQILNDLKDWDGDVENRRVPAGDLLGGRPNVLLSLALVNLKAADASRLMERLQAGPPGVGEVARLLRAGRVFEDSGRLVAAERQKAAAAAGQCEFERLREILLDLLDLAVPAV